jgi:large subunit ribosomal protein L9
MKNVEILLRDRVDHLGKVGDVVSVAAGYARNYLLPKGLAIQATPENVRLMARKRAKVDAEEAAQRAEHEQLVATLSEVRLQLVERADETGTLYGSVSAAMIATKLTEAGHPVDEKQVRLEHPLKSTGEHPVKIHIHGDLDAEVVILVAAAEA